MDTLLFLIGCLIYIPWLVFLTKIKWNKQLWSRQLLLSMLLLQMITILHAPPVMFIIAGISLIPLYIYIYINKPSFKTTPFLILSFIYILWFAISIYWSKLPFNGLIFLIDNGLPFLGFSLVASFLRIEKKELELLLRIFCYSAAIFITVCILCWGIGCVQNHIYPWRWPILQKMQIGGYYAYRWIFRFMGIDGYIHPSYNLLPVFTAAGISVWLSKEKVCSSYLWWFIWSGVTLLTLITQSRMGIIYSVVLFAGYILFGHNNLKIKFAGFVMFIILLIIVLSMNSDFWKQYGQDSTRERLDTYTWRYIQIKTFKGAGAGNLNPIEICKTIKEDGWPKMGVKSQDGKTINYNYITRPHNQLLADWVHAGLPAAIICLLLYVFAFIESYKKQSYWAAIFFVIFTIFSCLEPPLYIGKGLYLFCIINAILYSYYPVPLANHNFFVSLQTKLKNKRLLYYAFRGKTHRNKTTLRNNW